MLTQYASPEFAAGPGTEIDVPKKEAEGLIKGRFAVPVKRQAEKAVKPPKPEKATNDPD